MILQNLLRIVYPILRKKAIVFPKKSSEKNSDGGKSSYAGESQVNHDLAEKHGERDSLKDDVDSEGKKVYNKAPKESQDKGEKSNDGKGIAEITEQLEESRGYARHGDDGNRNYQGPEGNDPEKTFDLLGKYQAGHRLGNRTRAGSSGLLEKRYNITIRDYVRKGVFGDLRRRKLKSKDSAGRTISLKNRERLAETDAELQIVEKYRLSRSNHSDKNSSMVVSNLICTNLSRLLTIILHRPK